MEQNRLPSQNFFKIPSLIPQDLQLIQDLIGHIPTPEPKIGDQFSQFKTTTSNEEAEDDIASSGDEDSEKEVEEDILAVDAEDESPPSKSPVPSTPSASHEDSDSSSDSESEPEDVSQAHASTSSAKQQNFVDPVGDDDEEAIGPSGSSASHLMTQHEVAEADIVVPQITEVGPHEVLEPVGEVMSIVNNVVIVKGTASGTVRANEKALDSETLLVFEDRQVLGYIYETFGPTSQPLYQVKFSQSFPLDKEKVQVARPVFHVPDRSNFVFVRALKAIKGSDASNVWDEEPAEDELEFSDDEQEAAHKRSLHPRRDRSRGMSISSSRHGTPTPSQMRDQDMSEDPYTGSFDGNLSYDDMDLSAGPSRPPPVPYDDPYSDSYGLKEDVSAVDTASTAAVRTPSEAGSSDRGSNRGFERRGARRGNASRGTHDRGGGGRGRGRGNRSRGRGRGSWGAQEDGRQNGYQQPYPQQHQRHRSNSRSMSPTSLAIARATGQFMPDAMPDMLPHSPTLDMHTGPSHQAPDAWGYNPQYAQGYAPNPGYQGYSQPYIQPHINPRFASAFGVNFGFQPPVDQYPSYGYNPMNGNASAYGTGEWNQAWPDGAFTSDASSSIPPHDVNENPMTRDHGASGPPEG